MPLSNINPHAKPEQASTVDSTTNLYPPNTSQSSTSNFGEILTHAQQADADTSSNPTKRYPIDYNSYHSTKSSNSRIRFLVMHYTAQNFAGSVASLTGKSVSAHYLVPDPTDKSYQDAGFKELSIMSLVDEKDRAWHAGASAWGNRNNLNDTSLGIEMVNQASDDKGHFTFPPYNPQQIDALIQLANNILQRYPDITPVNVLAHSDIAPGRKSDPGAAFPWQQLHHAGIGAWYDDATKQKYLDKFAKCMPTTGEITAKLKTYGYDISGTTTDKGFKDLIRAFQLHFRQSDYSGVVDTETAATLFALGEKYFPGK